jgi:DNA-binding response OmpR family regulator
MEGDSQMAQESSRVLVVDDNQDVRDLVLHILSADGFHVYSASDGDTALAILAANPVDLVLLDVMMPGKSGLEVLREIRTSSQKSIRNIPVMMITAKSSTEDIDNALAIGANSYIVKPFRGITVREKVRSILELPSPDNSDERK